MTPCLRFTLFSALSCLAHPLLAGPTRPNIVWILVEDMSANFGCYGETRDLGRVPESEAMYLSDMKAFGCKPGQDPRNEREATLQRNVALMQEWADEGK